MIICPKCNEEIEEQSYYCDQCGQKLFYCSRCGHVGIGRRCTNCGGMMASPNDEENSNSQTSFSMGISSNLPGYVSAVPQAKPNASDQSNKSLKLSNSSLAISMQGLDGAIIGRRQGPYVQFFENNMYVSSVHAQLHYKNNSGWYIIDKHSSNGTKLNNRPIQPDVEMLLSDGDVVMIANVNLEVSIE
jgi:pSer/pThr/pTyr-binding forkhead associated (FHA) protein